MHHPNQNKSLPLIEGDLLAYVNLSQGDSSPPPPASPAPAYTALPYRDIDFHLAPIVNGRPGDIELETIDGKRFLVHKKILEAETVFFHI